MDQPGSGFKTGRLTGAALELDYAQLIAGIAAWQASSATGIAATLIAAPVAAVPLPAEALAIMFTGEPGWPAAVAALGCRFHPQVHAAPASIRRQLT